MTRRIELSPEALAHAQQVDRWWRGNRGQAPDLFFEELVAGIERIAAVPKVGKQYPIDAVPGLRRLLLLRTSYHIYYTVDEGRAIIRIHASWHARRGSGPLLG